MTSVELTTSWSELGLVVLSAAAMLTGLIVYVRIAGLRTFSKMASFDFAVTVAIGSLLASVVMSGSSLFDGFLAIAILIGLQALIALLRVHVGFSRVVDNRPLLLMAGSVMIEENLRRARVTSDDLRGKLREANVVNYDQVRYVVFEATGDVSVVHGPGDLDEDLLRDVIDGHMVTAPR